MDATFEKVFVAARVGSLRNLPPEILTEKNLLSHARLDGRTPLHEAAFEGHLDQLPPRFLTEKNVLTTDLEGATPLHEAAFAGHLNQIPSNALTTWNLTKSNGKGRTPLHEAALGGHLDQIPAEVLTVENLRLADHEGYTPGDLIDFEVLTKKLANTGKPSATGLIDYAINIAATGKNQETKDAALEFCRTAAGIIEAGKRVDTRLKAAALPRLFDAVRNGTLRDLPREYLTADLVTTPNTQGWTPLHEAASRGRLNQLPPAVFTEKNLLRTNEHGLTPLHVAIRAGHLNQIPRACLTQKTLLVKTASVEGWTPLHIAARTGQLSQIPPEVLTVKNLQTPDNQGETPGQLIDFEALTGHTFRSKTPPPPGLIEYARLVAEKGPNIDVRNAASEFAHAATLLAGHENSRVKDDPGLVRA